MRVFWSRLLALFRRRHLDEDLRQQLASHVDFLTDENLARGMTLEEARRAARLSMGGVEQVREACRDQRGFPFLEGLILDCRYGLRGLRRNPGFTAAVVLTFALGIGGNIAVSSVIQSVLLRPLPFPEPEELAAIESSDLDGTRSYSSAPGVYVDWRERATSFESIGGAYSTTMTLRDPDDPRRVQVAKASAAFFPTLRVRPLIGRLYTEEEDLPGTGGVALLDERFWRSRLNSRPDALGTEIFLNEQAYTVVGVVQVNALYPEAALWIPLTADRNSRFGGPVDAIGRLRQGVTLDAASHEMDVVMAGIRQERKEDSRTGVMVGPLHDWVVGNVRGVFWTMLGAVVFVLLVCCANIAGLLAARSATRQHEQAIRSCLGAGRWRLLRQALVETILLAFAGGSLGLALAAVLIRTLPSIRAFEIPRVAEIQADWNMLGIAIALTLSAALFAGVGPALQTALRDPGYGLEGSARGSSRTRSSHRFRSAMLAAQVALSLVLLAGAGLLANSFIRLLNIDTGFERSRVLTVRASLPLAIYDQAASHAFYRRLAEEISWLPGVELAALTEERPLDNVLFYYHLKHPENPNDEPVRSLGRHVSANYRRVLGIPLLAGRDLQPADDPPEFVPFDYQPSQPSPVPILINQTVGRLVFGAEDPLGKTLQSGYRSRPVFRVVGIVGDVRQTVLTEPPGPQIYVPLRYAGYPGYVLARTSLLAGNLDNAIRDTVSRLDPLVPLPEILSMEQQFDLRVAKPRFYLNLLGVFAVFGLLLAAVGCYGVTSYAVTQRMHEFAIRIALGARSRDVLRLVLVGGLRWTMAGILPGVAGALALTRLLESLLYEVRSNDPMTLLLVAVFLSVTTLGACFLAAARATEVDPNTALKQE